MLALKQWFHLLHVQGRSWYLYSRTGFCLKGNLSIKSYMCSRTRSHMMKCGPSHTTTCMCHSEVDAPWGRDLMSTETQNQPSNSILSQRSRRRNWSHRRRRGAG